MKSLIFLILGSVITLSIVGALGIGSDGFSLKGQPETLNNEDNSEPKVLYWVAPMDANFRRDGPGKSPMGMDLVPVYEKKGIASESGTVEVSSAMINNLGIKTEKVVLAYPRLSFISSGKVNYAKESLIHLHARTSGWIEKIYVRDVGEQVKKGQALYGIYSLELMDAQKDYLRSLDSQNEELMQAAKNRLKSLRVDNNVISDLKKTRKVSSLTTFYAPQSGFIEQFNINEGMYVKPENRLLTIADLSRLTVDIELDSQQATWLSQFPEDIIWTLTSDLVPNKSWQGKLDYIYPVLDETLRTIKVRLLLDNTRQLLKPNMWLTLTGNLIGVEKTLLIPRQALIRTENQNRVVIALSDGRFRSISVKPGQFFNQQVEIIAGLKEGDNIVTSAQFLIDSESNIDTDLQRMNSSDMDSSDMDSLDMDSLDMDSLDMDSLDMESHHDH